jgi:NAD(P)H-hydrate epimerase
VQLRAAEGVGVETAAWGDAGDAWLAEANIVIDAMFGTGLSRAVEGSPARAIDAINAWRRADGSRRVVAVDVPSGMDADTGEALEGGPCVHADATVTLGGIKKGLASRTGAPLAGRVTVGELALPRPLLERFADA